jgi:hypothetical protein
MELVFQRRIDSKAEVSHLAILPVVNHHAGEFVGKELLSDILLLVENE